MCCGVAGLEFITMNTVVRHGELTGRYARQREAIPSLPRTHFVVWGLPRHHAPTKSGRFLAMTF